VRFLFTRKFARLTLGLAVVGLTAALSAAELKPAEDPAALLVRIRGKMVQYLSQLPNYTCHQVINRLIRRASSSGFDHRDQVELEVAFMGNREFFAKPGATRFEEQPIQKMVPGGTISTGAFGSSANALFSREGAVFKFAGAGKKDGHATFRYDFQMPEEKSGFLVSHDSAQGIVAYKGSFWVDAETLDLVRLELKADHIPSYIGVRAVEESMTYKVMRIRDSDFLLPRDSQVAASDSAGNYSLNVTSLEHCREFAGQSVVTYDTPADNPPDGTSAERQAPEHR
jgi:hypothetical protein